MPGEYAPSAWGEIIAQAAVPPTSHIAGTIDDFWQRPIPSVGKLMGESGAAPPRLKNAATTLPDCPMTRPKYSRPSP